MEHLNEIIYSSKLEIEGYWAWCTNNSGMNFGNIWKSIYVLTCYCLNLY
jgi:hypothetical protein